MRPTLPGLTRSLGVVLLLGLAVLPRPAQAETTFCTPITAAPFTISAPGIYCLTQDIATNIAFIGPAINIEANNVVLDLNGHRLANLAAGPGTQARGILAFQRKNLTIKNGTVRGFAFGIVLRDDSETLTASQGHVIEDIRADQNTIEGIVVNGRGNIIRNNQVVATGGTTVSGFANADAVGIVVRGPENQVLNNDVIDTFETGTGSSFGIVFFFADNLAVNNRITQADFGIVYVATSGKFRDNLTSGVATPFPSPPPPGVTDAGNNN